MMELWMIRSFLLVLLIPVDGSTWLGMRNHRWSRTRSYVRSTYRLVQIPPRGGDGGDISEHQSTIERELTLDEKVQAAMKKLGLQNPSIHQEPTDHCTTDGVCTVPRTEPTEFPRANEQDIVVDDYQLQQSNSIVPPPPPPPAQSNNKQEDPVVLVDRIAESMKVDTSMVWAALGATSTSGGDGYNNNNRIYHEKAAREMIAMEMELIDTIHEDAPEVELLVSEGWGRFMARRALAFAELNVADARAILSADREDEQAEAMSYASTTGTPASFIELNTNLDPSISATTTSSLSLSESSLQSFPTVNVDANFDPTQIGTTSSGTDGSNLGLDGGTTKPIKPASRDDVVFDATTAQVQALVLESPVPVLLDIYADWCGPCKALSPILEEMTIKSGGMFRLVKINTDKERAISSSLEVTALPTIFAVRDGKILNMFQGMPQSEEMMRNFMMGLMIPGQTFQPPVTEKEQIKYTELTNKLLKVAGSAAFSFAARERLQNRVATMLEELIVQCNNDISIAEQSAQTIRTLLSNCLRQPSESKFRTVNFSNKIIEANVAQYPACVGILKMIGFRSDNSSSSSSTDHTLILGKNKKVINVAPLAVTRDTIDKWIDQTRFEVAKAARKRKDEEDRVQVQKKLEEAAMIKKEEDAQSKSILEKNTYDTTNRCKLQLRLDGKKKSYTVVLDADESLRVVIAKIPGLILSNDDAYQITCVAKRMIVPSTDTDALNMSFRELGLTPAAALVITVKSKFNEVSTESTLSLKERANAKKKKRGSHTMQSAGIYGADDNAKGELIDGGGGTLYEQDVSDDEEEPNEVNSDEVVLGMIKEEEEEKMVHIHEEEEEESVDFDE